ncbi:trypsin-like serine peptidase [Roseicitreum antarcticum]
MLALCLLSFAPPAMGPALGQESALRALDTLQAGRDWAAVGRLNIGGRGFCTGTLIEPHLVLTAAHCLYDRTTGAREEDANVSFLAGWRNGRADAVRGVRRSVVHPDYNFAADPDTTGRGVAHDLALLELDSPIRLANVVPFAVRSEPAAGDVVGVVSYARGRSDVPSLQEQCRILQRDVQGVLAMSCTVDFGASGAPVFAMRQGRPEIVSVVSAKSQSQYGEVALGMSLGARLDQLRVALGRGDARFIRVSDSAARDGTRRMSDGGGARFVRP